MTDLPATFGKYTLVEPLGEGGMARVYRAFLSGPGGFKKQVAIKQLLPHVAQDEKLVQLMFNEARLGGFLQHANLVEVYEFGEVEGTYYLAMEYVDGVTMQAIVRRTAARGPLPAWVVLRIATAICTGLAYAHDAVDDEGRPMSLVHRDLKPANVMIRRDGVVKIADFGVAKAQTNLTHTTTGMTRGTPQYMSPEQVRGESAGALDRRSDLFSLTSLLAELITGRVAFDESNLMQLLNRIAVADAGDTLARVTRRFPEMVPVLQRGFCTDPAKRYADADEMASALREVRSTLPPEQRGDGELGAWLAQWMSSDGAAADGPTTTGEPTALGAALGVDYTAATADPPAPTTPAATTPPSTPAAAVDDGPPAPEAVAAAPAARGAAGPAPGAAAPGGPTGDAEASDFSAFAELFSSPASDARTSRVTPVARRDGQPLPGSAKGRMAGADAAPASAGRRLTWVALPAALLLLAVGVGGWWAWGQGWFTGPDETPGGGAPADGETAAPGPAVDAPAARASTRPTSGAGPRGKVTPPSPSVAGDAPDEPGEPDEPADAATDSGDDEAAEGATTGLDATKVARIARRNPRVKRCLQARERGTTVPVELRVTPDGSVESSAVSGDLDAETVQCLESALARLSLRPFDGQQPATVAIEL